jgi:ferric-dicitrate binding protein FerR (iron transport regulator)
MLKKYIITLSKTRERTLITSSFCIHLRRLVNSYLILLLIGLWLISPTLNLTAEEVKKDHLSLWAQQQSTKLEKRIALYRKREAQALAALEKSRSVLKHAEEINDQKAAAVARKAMAISERAMAKVRLKIMADEARLEAVGKAYKFKSKTYLGLTSIAKGGVYKKTNDGWKVFDGSTPLIAGDEIRTGPDGFTEIILTDGSKIQLGSNSNFKAARLGEEISIYEMLKGRVHAEYDCIKKHGLPCSRRLHLRTPKVNIAVRGTEFSLEVQPGGSVKVIVLEGVLELSEPNGAGDGVTIMVGAGEKAAVRDDGSIVGPTAIDTGSSDRWWEEW